MTPIDKRWIEMQFYSLCLKVYRQNNDIQDIMTFLETLGSIFHFNTELAKHTAQKLVITLRAKSRRKETALIAREKGIHVDRIQAITGYNKRYLYTIFQNSDLHDYLRFYPTWTEPQINVMQDVISCVTKMKEWTI